MSIICALFGHKAPGDFSYHAGMAGGYYLQLDHPRRDNIGRVHLLVFGTCPRCEKRHEVGMMHLSQAERFMHLGGEVKP